MTIPMGEVQVDVPNPWKLGIIGAGGAGNFVVGDMAVEIDGVTYILFNTDAQFLATCFAEKKFIKRVVIGGEKTTKGRGAGARPIVGLRAARESEGAIKDALKGLDFVIIFAGFGGGTGTGCAGYIASIAKSMGILTFLLPQMSFAFEQKGRKMRGEKEYQRILRSFDKKEATAKAVVEEVAAETVKKEGVEKTESANGFDIDIEPESPICDVIFPADNDNLLLLPDAHKKDFKELFMMLNQHAKEILLAIANMIMHPCWPNLDLADMHTACYEAKVGSIGYGRGEGEKRVDEAIKMAFGNILFGKRIRGRAKNCIINISGAPGKLPLEEVERIMAAAGDYLRDVDDNSVICGCSYYTKKKMEGGREVEDAQHDEITILAIFTGHEVVPGEEEPARVGERAVLSHSAAGAVRELIRPKGSGNNGGRAAHNVPRGF